MTASEKHHKFEQIAQKIDPHSKLLRAWELKGGVSAQVTALEIERPNGQTQKMIVRQHGAVDLQHNPQIAADEFKLLQITQSARLATPAPLYLDQSGDIFANPYIVIEFVDGETKFVFDQVVDFIPQLAAHLARIHAIDCSSQDLAFLPKQEQRFTQRISNRPHKLDESIGEGRIRDILESLSPISQHNPNVLLHGDYWPGNVLWRDGRLVAVIDWEDAAVGDPLADVANSRLEILWAFDIDAMQNFTQHYQSTAPINFANLPIWDLFAALRPAFKIDEWADDDVAAQRMRERHKVFVAQAFEKLGQS
jgi:aminoglycoside phosphotransferase (APT) family kinase protein